MPQQRNVLPDCVFCLDAPTDPCTTVCGHIFCRTCIRDYDSKQRIIRKATQCPVCKGNLSSTTSRFIKLHCLVEKQVKSSSPVRGDTEDALHTPEELRRALADKLKGKGKAKAIWAEEGDSETEEEEEDPINDSDADDSTDRRIAASRLAEERIAHLEAQIVALGEELTETKSELSHARDFNLTELGRLNDTIKAREGLARTATNRAQAEQKMAQRAKKTAEEATRSAAEASRTLEDERTKWRREKVGLKDELAVVKDERDGLQMLLAKHEESVREAQEIAAEEASKAESLRTALEAAEEQIHAKDARIEKYRADKIEASQQVLQKLRHTNGIQRTTIDALRAQLSGQPLAPDAAAADPSLSSRRDEPYIVPAAKSRRDKGKGRAPDFPDFHGELASDDLPDAGDWSRMIGRSSLNGTPGRLDAPIEVVDDRDFVMPGIFQNDSQVRAASPRRKRRPGDGDRDKEDRVMRNLQAGGKGIAVGEKKRIRLYSKR